MAHTPADTKARQNALGAMFRKMSELEAVITEAEGREQRMNLVESAKKQAAGERFPAIKERR